MKDKILNALLDDSEDAVTVLDDGGAVVAWSHGATELLGAERSAAVGKPFSKFFADRHEAGKALEAARGVAVLKNYETRLLRDDGSREKVYLTLKHIPGEPPAFLVSIDPTVVDFSVMPEHRAVQEALVRMERFSSIGRMTAAFAHEMRSPLHVITSTAEFGLDFLSPDSKMRENLEMIHRNASHASLSIKALLDFAKVGKSHLREGSINDVARSALELIEKVCGRQGVELKVSLGEVPKVMIDEPHVRSVIHNLLANAMEAMPGRGGTLGVATDRVDGGGARLVISDTGIGMPPQILAKVGAPFFTTKEDGTGLGLYLAKRVLAEHGATISFDTKRGQGTKVTVLFSAR